MISLPTGTKIWLVAGITNMRNGFNGLAAKVQMALKDDPMSGHVFIFRVLRTVREKHACAKCDVIVQTPAPLRPIERGIAGPGLLARVLTSKYADHTPLYRQSEIYARQGVDLCRSVLSG